MLIIGADENGYGCVAGPLLVTAVLMNDRHSAKVKCRDSKAYASARKMAQAVEADRKYVLSMHVCEIPADEVAQDYSLAMRKAYDIAIWNVRMSARDTGQHVERTLAPAILDGIDTHGVGPCIRNCQFRPKADATTPSVSIASCIGKLRQIERMAELHQEFPEYGFHDNAGYCTPFHLTVIKTRGAIATVHRLPVLAAKAKREGWTLTVIDRKTRCPLRYEAPSTLPSHEALF